MNFRKLLLLITILLTSTANTPVQSDDEEESASNTTSNINIIINNSEEEAKKRKRLCPGCKQDLMQHQFGHPHKDCTGPPPNSDQAEAPPPGTEPSTSSSTSTAAPLLAAAPPDPAPSSTENFLPDLRKHLQRLEEQEKIAIAKAEEQHLLQKIAEKEASIQRLRTSFQHSPPTLTDFSTATQIPAVTNSQQALHPPPQVRTATVSTAYNAPTMDHLLSNTVGHVLEPQQQCSGFDGFGNRLSLAQMFKQQEQRGATTKTCDNGQGKTLRIMDSVSRLRPTEEEKVVSTDSGSQTTLLLSIGNKKPNLESVTVEQFSIANIRIFYELLTSGRLPTAADIRDYLSYSVKVLELARKYTWESVLKYDDEYRVLQHTYGYPWSKDQSHLHEVVLIPRYLSSSQQPVSGGNNNNNRSGNRRQNSSSPPTGAYNALGQEICRNFNRPQGCQKLDCKFVHCCNRKVAGLVCGKTTHAGYMHSAAVSGSPGK